MKTRCALCGDPLAQHAGAWRHAGVLVAADEHDPLVECPRCGKNLDGGSPFAMAGRDIPFPPYMLFAIAFWTCRRCGGVWHRWGTDNIDGVVRRWGPDDERRERVEAYFAELGGKPDGEGVTIT